MKQRNDDRHGKDLEARIKAHTEHIKGEVEQLYKRADEVPARVINSVFKCDLDIQLCESHWELIAKLANWIRVVEASLLHHAKTHNENSLALSSAPAICKGCVILRSNY